MKTLTTVLLLCTVCVTYTTYSDDSIQIESKLLYKRAVDTLLSAWTQLDLLASTRNSQENYCYFGKVIVEQLLDLRMFLLFLYNVPYKQNISENDHQYLWSLVQQVYDRLTEMKEPSVHPQVLCAQVIAEHIIEMSGAVSS